MKNKYDILTLIFIIIVFSIFFYFFHTNIYNPFSDIGREMYIPWQMNKGMVLYKDIYNIFAPLGYMLNALLLKFASDNINLFLYTGYFLSVLCLIPLFLISKFYTNTQIAAAISMVIIVVCFIFPDISNYITPYSYSIEYALAAVLWGFYFLLNYISLFKPVQYSIDTAPLPSECSDKNKYIVLSCLCFGFSLSCKYEFIGVAALLIFIMFKQKPPVKIILKSVISFIFFPLLCLGILLIQNCSFSDLFNAANNTISFSKGNMIHSFYKYYHFFPQLPAEIYNTWKSSIGKIETVFFFSGYLCLLLFLIQLFVVIKKRKLKSEQDFLLLLLLMFGLLSSLKVIGCINLKIYGTFFFPMLFIAIIAFLHQKLFAKKTVITILICMIIFIPFFIFDCNSNKLMYIKTPKGDIRIIKELYTLTDNLLHYIENNITADKTLLIVPEGVFFNYITGINSNNKIYQLEPANFYLHTSGRVIKELQVNQPDYIICTNIMYMDYAQKSFMRSYGKNVYQYILNNYIEEQRIGNDFIFIVYKKK